MDKKDITLIRRVAESDAPEIARQVNAVCAERWYLSSLTGFTEEQTRSFLVRSIASGFPHFVAESGERGIVGWCDIIPFEMEGYRHVGQLGMGVAKGCRGNGLGSQLLKAALDAARSYGLERVALVAYSDNKPAIKLYETHGFCHEGLKRKARKVDGHYQDVTLMALLF